MPDDDAPLLECIEVTKGFGGIRALDAVSLHVQTSEAVGLVGPNGAGKTTLFNCMLGLLRPDDGKVRFDGRDLTRTPVHKRARLGIGRTFQRTELFPGMTAREHLLVAERARRGDGSLLKDLINKGRPKPEEIERAGEVLDLLGLESFADRPIEALTLGQSRLVEIGRSLIGEPRLLLLDEPSSGLDVAETQVLGGILKMVQRDRGTAILLVEHDLDLVRQVAERLYVLDFGRTLVDGPCAEVLRNEQVITAYLGVGA